MSAQEQSDSRVSLAQPQAVAATADAEFIRRDQIDPGSDYVAPNSPTERRLAEIWQTLLRIDQVGIDDSFFELGGDSLEAMDLFLELGREFGITLSPATIIARPTIAQLAAFLRDGAEPKSGQCLVALQTEGADPPLYLIHDGSGTLFSYRDLLNRLGKGRKIYGLQYPEHAQNPPADTLIPHIAEMYVDAIKDAQPSGPYFLAGYSFGGFVAYEMARTLHARGDHVGLLALIDPRLRSDVLPGPQLMLRKLSHHLQLMSDQTPSQWMAHLINAIRVEIGLFTNRRHRREDHAMQDQLPARMQELGSVFRLANAAYTALPYGGSAKLLRTSDAPCSRRCLGWSDVVRGGVEIFDVPGGHHTAMLEPVVALVAAYLQQWIDQAAKH